MDKLEVAKKIVKHGDCFNSCHHIGCGNCPAFDIVLSKQSHICTINWNKEDNLSGDEYTAAKKVWFENWIKENEKGTP